MSRYIFRFFRPYKLHERLLAHEEFALTETTAFTFHKNLSNFDELQIVLHQFWIIDNFLT